MSLASIPKVMIYVVDVAIFVKGNQAPSCLNNHLEALLANQKVCVIPYFFFQRTVEPTTLTKKSSKSSSLRVVELC